MHKKEAHSIIVLMCTYNGARFLEDQLTSIIKQTITPRIIISDDGSTDTTLDIIQRFQQNHPDISIQLLQGPRKGFQYHFLSFLNSPEAPADFIAFSDQDDIWEADKLEKAIDWLSTLPPGQPGLYGSRTQIIDEQGRPLGYSPLFKRAPSFANALVQNIFGGNTMVFNRATWSMLHQAHPNKLVSHDWWVYQMVTGVGGHIFYDSYPSVRYRQHADNLVGANTSLKARWHRLCMLMQNRFKEWNEVNTTTLLAIVDQLTPENQLILKHFSKARQANMPLKLIYFKQSGVYRQTALGMIALWVSLILGKC